MLTVGIIATWAAVGVVAVMVMRRRGHEPFGWSIVFLFLGPLALPIAISADRHRPPESDRPIRQGELDVLVAHDGSPAASAALDAALALVGTGMTSMTLGEVVDIEAATTVSGRDTTRAAQERLDDVAVRLAPLTACPIATVVLHGDPAHALADFAAENGYELIVVGGSGPGSAWVRRGSVARRLAACSSVAVLIGPNATVHSEMPRRARPEPRPVAVEAPTAVTTPGK
jgi:nucleotide-binding universal stress UspA family protein